jgi:hypothetical protein
VQGSRMNEEQMEVVGQTRQWLVQRRFRPAQRVPWRAVLTQRGGRDRLKDVCTAVWRKYAAEVALGAHLRNQGQ